MLTKAGENGGGGGEDVPHEPDLRAFLLVIGLIDADGVDPDVLTFGRFCVLVHYLLQSIEAVFGHEVVGAVDFDSL